MRFGGWVTGNVPIWMTTLAVGLGSGLGGVLRFLISAQMQLRFGDFFPLGTLAVNVLGSFFIGILVSLTEPVAEVAAIPDRRFQAWLEFGLPLTVTGFCGGFTTFSTFSLQTLELLQDGRTTAAGLNAALNLALCLVAVWTGWILGRSFRS